MKAPVARVYLRKRTRDVYTLTDVRTGFTQIYRRGQRTGFAMLADTLHRISRSGVRVDYHAVPA